MFREQIKILSSQTTQKRRKEIEKLENILIVRFLCVCDVGQNRFSNRIETLSELSPYYVHLRPTFKYFRPINWNWI